MFKYWHFSVLQFGSMYVLNWQKPLRVAVQAKRILKGSVENSLSCQQNKITTKIAVINLPLSRIREIKQGCTAGIYVRLLRRIKISGGLKPKFYKREFIPFHGFYCNTSWAYLTYLSIGWNCMTLIFLLITLVEFLGMVCIHAK